MREVSLSGEGVAAFNDRSMGSPGAGRLDDISRYEIHRCGISRPAPFFPELGA